MFHRLSRFLFLVSKTLNFKSFLIFFLQNCVIIAIIVVAVAAVAAFVVIVVVAVVAVVVGVVVEAADAAPHAAFAFAQTLED